MAEPAHKLDDSADQEPVYDRPGAAPSNPRARLRSLEGGGETSDPKRGHLKDVGKEGYSAKELSGAEDSTNEVAHEDTVGAGYKAGAKTKQRSGVGRFLWGSRRRKAVSGGVLALIVSAVIAIVSLLSGPLQFIHLSQTLQKNFFGTQHTVQIRNKGLFRYLRANNESETRLGAIGKTVYRNTLSQLKEQGIEFGDYTRGVPGSMTIDTSQNDAYKDLPAAERENAIARNFKISDASIISETGSLGSGVFKIDLNNTTLKGIDFTKSLSQTAIKSLGNGKIQTGLALRFTKQAWDLPRLWSPLDKAQSVAKNKFSSALARKKAAQQAEQERVTAEETAVTDTPKALAAKATIKDLLSKNKDKISAGLIGSAVLCAVRSSANAAVLLNRAAIVLPATVQAADKIAIGSQIQSNKNFDLLQLGAIADGFTDSKGQSIWAGQALQATEGSTNPGGPDLPGQYGEAFSGKTTADHIKNIVDIKVLGISITGAACSTAGQIVQAAAGLALLISGFFDAGGSWAAYSAEMAANTAAAAGVLYLFEQEFGNIISDKAIVPDVLSGPVGGNLLAYGARELGNVGARSMGGVALAGTEGSVLTQAEEQQYDQEFKSQSIATRLFDVYDSRSTISKFIDQTSTSPVQNLAKIGGIFTHFGSFVSNVFSPLMPQAAAADTPYNWGFPQYGIPDNVAENAAYQDPYANADKVAIMLDGADGGTIKTRAEACFGVKITKELGKWAVVADNDTNPDTTDYSNAKCDDTSSSWQRVQLFVFDSRLMDTSACYLGVDDQSCSNLDEGGASSTTTSSGSSDGTHATIDVSLSNLSTSGGDWSAQVNGNTAALDHCQFNANGTSLDYVNIKDTQGQTYSASGHQDWSLASGAPVALLCFSIDSLDSEGQADASIP